MRDKSGKKDKKRSPIPQREWIALGLILLLAFGLRLVFFLQLSSSSIADMVIEDSKTYHDWAVRIGGGSWVSDEVFYALPLYPYFLGIIYAVFGVSLSAARFSQILMGTVNCFLIYLLGKRLFNGFTGLVAALAMAVYGWLIVYDAAILSPVLIIFLIASLLLFLVRLDRKNAGPAGWLGGGILAGITAAASAHILLFILLVPIWKHLSTKWHDKRSGWFSSLAFLGGAIIALSPITIHNLAAGSDFVPLTAHGGINFFIGNNPHARGVFEPPPILRSGGKTLRRDAEKLAEKDRGRNLKPSEISSYWFEKGFNFIRENPLDYIVLLGKKFTIFWDNLEIADVIHPSFFTEFTPILKFYFLTFGMIAPFSLIGLVVAWGQRKRIVILYVLVGTYVLSTVLYFVNSRYRLSLVPFLLIFAAYFIWWSREQLRKHRWPIFSAAAAGLIFFAVWVNPELIGMDSRFTLNMGAGYNHLGSYYSQKGELDKALIQFKKALRLEPYRAEAHYNLANIYYRMGDFDRALGGYRDAIRRNPFYDSAHLAIALVYEKMGKTAQSINKYREILANLTGNIRASLMLSRLLISENRIGEAVDVLEAAGERHPRRLEPVLYLAGAYERAGKNDEARRVLEAGLERMPASGRLHLSLGQLLSLDSGRTEAALSHLRRARELMADDFLPHLYLGDFFYRRGDRRRARKEWETARRLRPDNPDIQRRLQVAGE